jgi:short chain dehydrogenase
MESLTPGDIESTLKVLNTYAKLVSDGSLNVLIKDDKNLQELNRLLSVINKTKSKKKARDSKEAINKVNTNTVDGKVPSADKWLQSMAGSGTMSRDDVPKEGECMNTPLVAAVSSKGRVESIEDPEDSEENKRLKLDVSLKDPFDHLYNLKTSTNITAYDVKQYSEKEVRHCVICGTGYSKEHPFYHQFCQECADFNYAKRTQTFSATGRVALVTGMRAKIGYEIALKLLRSGCRVIGTTRFPKDAIRRYSLEPDFEEWKVNLTIFAIDFRNLTAVGVLINHINATYPHLDILVNNAAQTVRKPPDYYKHLIEGEAMQDPTVVNNGHLLCHVSIVNETLLREIKEQDSTLAKRYSGDKPISVASLMSQIALLPEEKEGSTSQYFPEGKYDYFGQQLDLRPVLTTNLGKQLGHED